MDRSPRRNFTCKFFVSLAFSRAHSRTEIFLCKKERRDQPSLHYWSSFPLLLFCISFLWRNKIPKWRERINFFFCTHFIRVWVGNTNRLREKYCLWCLPSSFFFSHTSPMHRVVAFSSLLYFFFWYSQKNHLRSCVYAFSLSGRDERRESQWTMDRIALHEQQTRACAPISSRCLVYA